MVSIFTVYNLLDFKSDKILFLLILTTVLITYDPYLFAGYQEYLIFSILLISARFISLIDFTKKDQKKNIFLNLIILSILIWFKSEGLIYFLIFGSLLVIINKATLKIKFHYFITIFFIVLLQYFLKQYIICIYESQHSFNIKEFVYLFNNFELLIFKILNISKHLIIGFVKYPLWLITILSLLLIKSKNNKDKEIIKYFIVR